MHYSGTRVKRVLEPYNLGGRDCVSLVGSVFTLTLALSLKGEGISVYVGRHLPNVTQQLGCTFHLRLDMNTRTRLKWL